MEPLERLHSLIDNLFTYERKRKENLKKLRQLFIQLKIGEKVADIEELLTFNALNVTGLSLQKESLLQPQPGKYLQIIGIKKVDNRSKNINLRYFGKVENLENGLLQQVGEFVLRWRLEKGFMHLESYKELLDGIEREVESKIS